MKLFAQNMPVAILAALTLLFLGRPTARATELTPIVTPLSYSYSDSWDFLAAGHYVWNFYYEPDDTWTPHASSASSTWNYGQTGQLATEIYYKMTIIDTNTMDLDEVSETNQVAAYTPTVPWTTGTRTLSYNASTMTTTTTLGLLTRGYTNSQASSVFKLTVAPQPRRMIWIMAIY